MCFNGKARGAICPKLDELGEMVLLSGQYTVYLMSKMLAAVHKCALAYIYSAQPPLYDTDSIRGYDHTWSMSSFLLMFL